jgi:hypothetical protein
MGGDISISTKIFLKIFFEKVIYIAHRLSPPLAIRAPLTPIRSFGTLSTILVWNLVQKTASLLRRSPSVVIVKRLMGQSFAT